MMVLSKSWIVLVINFEPSFYLLNLASISIFIANRSIPSNGWIETCFTTSGRRGRNWTECLQHTCLLTASMRSCVGSCSPAIYLTATSSIAPTSNL